MEKTHSCKCGSNDHKNVKHKYCPLNKNFINNESSIRQILPNNLLNIETTSFDTNSIR